MSRETIFVGKLADPAGPLSTAVRAGNFIYASGQVAQDPATGKLFEGGIAQQTEQIFANLRTILEAAEKTFSDVVRVGIFVTDMRTFGTVNEIYKKYFTEPYPARTTVAVAALPLGAAVEIDMIVKD
jgi:2-iminobutanoate/2-iminopropanoate deaminase